MSKSNTNLKVWKTPCLGNCQSIISLTRGHHVDSVMIAAISVEQDKLLDAGKDIDIIATHILDKGKHVKYHVSIKDVYCYGKIDFSNSSDDFATIEDFYWADSLPGMQGIHIPNYRFTDNTIIGKTMIETWNCGLIAQYKYGLIGKPELCVIFKHYK